MAVEARNLNLLQLFNPVDYTLHASSTNMYGNIINNNNATNSNMGLMQTRLVPSTGTSTTVDNNNSHPADLILPYYSNDHRTFVTGGPLQLHHLPCRPGGQFHHPPSQQTLKDDSGITFNNNAVPPASRKRSRDDTTTNNNITDSAPLTNSTTPLPPLMSLSTVAATADARKKSFYGSSIRSCGGSSGSDWYSFLDQDLSIQMMQYELELDRFISVQMEKVRLEMEQRRRKQSTKIISVIEEALVNKLRARDSEIDKMGRINFALEEKIKSLCLENQFWRDLAQTNEATANGLRTNLEQLLASQQLNNNKQPGLQESAGACAAAPPGGAEDVASCCGSSAHEQGEDEVNTQQLRWRKVSTKTDAGVAARLDGFKEAAPFVGRGAVGKNTSSGTMCRKCGKVESSVLLLPCRHLCVCATCGPTVDNCPICNFLKESSVPVYLS